MAVPALSGCTEFVVAPYRDDALLAGHKYLLGEQYIQVDGLRLCYQERGQGETVLILPGLATTIDYWQLNLPALAAHYHVVVLEPPGFGKSDKPDVSYDLLWLRDRILAFMDAKGIRRASLIGGSLGGHLALLIAMEQPQRVDKLVLMGSSGAWPPTGFLLAGGLRAFWNDAVVTDHLRRNWPDIHSKLFIRQTPVTQAMFRYQMAVRADATRYAPEGRASSRALLSIFFHSCLDRLGRVRQPTLLVWGAADQFHLHSEARRFREHLPDARLVIVSGAAHEVMVDQPNVFNDLVTTFLRQGLAAVKERREVPRAGS